MANFDFSQLNGNVIRSDGTKVEDVTAALSGKGVFIYFSAHWCPPCRGFTPVLKQFYEDHHDSKNFEIIFVSSDKNSDEFKAYFAEMADYLALDFSDKTTELVEEVKKFFNVSGIPMLVFLSDQGAVRIANARGAVSGEADSYPWGK